MTREVEIVFLNQFFQELKEELLNELCREKHKCPIDCCPCLDKVSSCRGLFDIGSAADVIERVIKRKQEDLGKETKE